MHLKPRSDMKVVKKEEKEAHLKAFIAAHLESHANSGHDQASTYLLVVRSMESPVVRALASLAPELARAGVRLKMILSAIDQPSPFVQTPSQDQDTGTITALARMARDPRLFDLHEQLVMGETCSWIGDVIRREPAKRDAYENYCANCKKTASWAHHAFDRIWDSAKPIVGIELTTGELAPSDQKIAPIAAVVSETDTNDATIGTRH